MSIRNAGSNTRKEMSFDKKKKQKLVLITISISCFSYSEKRGRVAAIGGTKALGVGVVTSKASGCSGQRRGHFRLGNVE